MNTRFTILLYHQQMKIILDTNSIKDVLLKSVLLDELNARTDRLKLSIFIPEIVLIEKHRLFEEEFKSNFKSWGQSSSFFSLLNENSYSPPLDFNEAIELYSKKLSTRLQKLNISVIETPQINTNVLLQRDINTVRPFDRRGRGFRDTLIWLSVLNEAKDNQSDIAFVTDDKIFWASYGGGVGKLHADFDKDLHDSGINGNKIRLYKNLEALIIKGVRPDAEKIWKAGDSIEGSFLEGFDIQSAIDSLKDALTSNLHSSLPSALGMDAAGAYVYQIKLLDFPFEPKIIEGFKLNTNDVLVTVEGFISFDVEFIAYRVSEIDFSTFSSKAVAFQSSYSPLNDYRINGRYQGKVVISLTFDLNSKRPSSPLNIVSLDLS